MYKNFFLILLYLTIFFSIYLRVEGFEKTTYPLVNERIDVVMPTAPKDVKTIDIAIEGIRKNCKNLGRIIVISSERLTDHAEWFDESQYPFSKFDVALYLNKMDKNRATKYLNKRHSRVGWYYAQLLKFYAGFVIPGISSNILIVDSDTVFLRPVEFMNEKGEGLYNPGTEYHKPYFVHMNKLLPGLRKVFPDLSGISHHLLMQKPILEDLFSQVESYHQVEFWKAFCRCVDPTYVGAAGAAEFEIYFNFAFDRTDQVHLRNLKWGNSSKLELLDQHRTQGYDYMSYHSYLRNKNTSKKN